MILIKRNARKALVFQKSQKAKWLSFWFYLTSNFLSRNFKQLLTNFGALYEILEQLVADGFSHAG